VAGLAGNANVFAMSLSYTAFMIWCAPKKMPMWMHLLGILLVFYGFYYSGSRKTLVVMAVGLIGLIFWALFRWKKVSTWAILTGCLVLSVFAVMYIQVRHIDVMEKLTNVVTVKRLTQLFSGKQSDDQESRMGMIEEGIQLWKMSPVVGLGASQYEVYSSWASYSHNNYTELLATMG